VDWINVMAYDLHGSWDPVTGPHTALRADDGLSIEHAVDLYLGAGVPAQKLHLGLAGYGRTWTLANPANHVYGSAATGTGVAGTCTQEAGFLSSVEIANMVATGGQMALDSASQTAYAWKGNQFVTFDTLATHKVKTDYICSKALGGVMFWAMDLDDSFKMINAIHDNLATCSSTSGGGGDDDDDDDDDDSDVAPVTCDVARRPCDDSFLACTVAATRAADVCACIDPWKSCLDTAGCPASASNTSPRIRVTAA
jgi:hypothetical protein